ncbi:Transcriptional regulatory protein QseB [Marinomonas gallaica]|uniref:Transcriptional regulatory protein QseB n=1 Tax=Marinomonas gallaica TaxID=1806667 RepID=A0A1C3JV95_9GAMM|nr:response regulator [Marinomonas gallaica]SBT19022.1 Transcriptional regulatory protein QseB [Marinomonas gallaica]SBT21977.1 Transcriptional regulatory protein QseB [Marinomonas gallaica]
MRILVVEDDTSLGDGLCVALKREGFTADWLTDGLQAMQAVEQETFDLVILDLGLPRMDGMSILTKIREKAIAVPVLVLTARDGIDDRVGGLDAGADDYVVKPFDLVEIMARIRAIVRRSKGRAVSLITHNDIELSPDSMQVTYQGKGVTLTRREYVLLSELLSRPGHVFTRDALVQSLYGWGEEVESNALEVHIHHLRKKFYSELIRTIRGVGYVIEKPVGE